MSDVQQPSEHAKRRWINPRILAMLAVFLVIICTLVIATDHFSPRDRHPGGAASGPAAATKEGA